MEVATTSLRTCLYPFMPLLACFAGGGGVGLRIFKGWSFIVQGPKHFPKLWWCISCINMISSTSNRPQSNIGNYFCTYSRLACVYCLATRPDLGLSQDHVFSGGFSSLDDHSLGA